MTNDNLIHKLVTCMLHAACMHMCICFREFTLSALVFSLPFLCSTLTLPSPFAKKKKEKKFPLIDIEVTLSFEIISLDHVLMFIFMWPCTGLTTCPGCNPDLCPKRDGMNSALGRDNKWVEIIYGWMADHTLHIVYYLCPISSSNSICHCVKCFSWWHRKPLTSLKRRGICI